MNWLDIIIIAGVIIGIIHGIFTGIVKQVISLVSLVAAILLSGAVANMIRNWIEPNIQLRNNLLAYDIQFTIYYIIAFILIISLFSIAAGFVDKIINYTPAGFINKIFGALFGVLLWALCLSILFNVLAVFDSHSQVIPVTVKENSLYYEKVKMIFPMIFPYIEGFFKLGH